MDVDVGVVVAVAVSMVMYANYLVHEQLKITLNINSIKTYDVNEAAATS